ncbi:MAG: drug/metabolite transporter (DMT)-like permease [Cyclobacteriaceae bacterium]|jgi:drug/metabolite transporter (DMT)-like permease
MSTQNSSHIGSYAHLHFLVLIWGITAVLGKLISIPAMEVVFYRTFFAFIVLYFIVKFRKSPLAIGKRNFYAIFGTGSIIASHWILFFLAARVSNVSICLAGMATTSIWTSILEPIMLKRKIKMYEPILGLIALVGISVVFRSVIDQYIGFLIAVFSAMLSSIFTIINGQLVKKSDHYVISFYQMLGACICTLIFMLIYSYGISGNSIQWDMTQSDLIYLSVLSLICTVYAYSASIKLMHKLSAFAINLTINLEPVYGIILAVLIFGNSEYMGTSFYWGTLIILISVLLYPIFSYFERKRNSIVFTQGSE